MRAPKTWWYRVGIHACRMACTAFMRSIIIGRILERLLDRYPKFFILIFHAAGIVFMGNKFSKKWRWYIHMDWWRDLLGHFRQRLVSKSLDPYPSPSVTPALSTQLRATSFSLHSLLVAMISLSSVIIQVLLYNVLISSPRQQQTAHRNGRHETVPAFLNANPTLILIICLV